MLRIMKLNSILLAVVALTMVSSPAATETKNQTEFDCRVTVVTHASGSPKQGRRAKRMKVCPYLEQMAAGKCELVAGKGMRCIAGKVSPPKTHS